MTHALEGVRPLFDMRPLFNMRGTGYAWRTRAAWSVTPLGTANVGHVQTTGRAAARIRAIAKLTTTLKRRRLVSAELASRLGRRAGAAKLLPQRLIPIEYAP